MKKALVIFCLLNISLTVSAAKPGPKDCQKAMAQFKKQETLETAKAVEAACNPLVQKACETKVEKYELSGHDAELVLMGCALRSAYAANLALGNGKATSICKEAVTHLYTAFTQTAADNAGICVKENEKLCAALSSDVEKAKCEAKSAVAAYKEASSAKSLELDPEMDKIANDVAQKEVEKFIGDSFPSK